MSEHLELALLTRAMLDSDFHSVEKARLDESFFSGDVAKEVYRYLRDTFHNPISSGQVPSWEMVKSKFPSFYPANAPDSVSILAKELKEAKIRTELQILAQSLQLKAVKSPLEALAELRAGAAAISNLEDSGEDLSLSGAYNLLLNNYNTVQQAGGIIGIPYPWAALNEETQGKLNGQFIVLYGRPKSMKSWVAIYMAIFDYVFCRRRVLFYTREMSPVLVLQRAAATIAGVDYKAFKTGKLQPEVSKHVFTILQELLEDEKSAGAHGLHQPCFVVTSDRSAKQNGNAGGVSWLQAKIRDMKPDVVYVDGMYLMRDDRSNQRSVDWKQIAHISQDLKLTAQDFDVPLIGVTQASRAAQKTKGEDLTELAYADALGQDADAVFRVNKNTRVDEQTKQKRTELLITAPGLREGVLDGIVIHGQPATNFGFIKSITNLEDLDDNYGETKGGNNQPGKKYARPEHMDHRVAMKGTIS